MSRTTTVDDARDLGPPSKPEAPAPKKKGLERLLDTVEKVGNAVPHPAVIFVILIGMVITLSHILYLLGASVTYESLNPDSGDVEMTTTAAQSLLTGEGLRFMFAAVVENFMNFNAVGVIIVAMLGVGVADGAGLIGALIRKLVTVAPRPALTYILVFVGILSSVAADAGYLVLIPLAASAFLSVGRHPIAGLAASFAGDQQTHVHGRVVEQSLGVPSPNAEHDDGQSGDGQQRDHLPMQVSQVRGDFEATKQTPFSDTIVACHV